MRVNEAIFAPGFKCEPYWWDAAPRPRRPPEPLPDEADIAIVGSGYTGLSAALTLARAGRAITVIEAGDPGCGASSRNAGFVGKTLKHSLAKLMNEGGTRRAVAVWNEVFRAFDYVTGLIEEQRIDCHFVRCGRFMGASSPRHYETLARELELRRKHLGQESEMVLKAEQHREIGSEIYHGGAVIPDLGALHPGLYHLGLLDRVRDAGVQVIANTPVTGLARDRNGFTLATRRGTLRAREVLVATNGYTGGATPYLRRRVVPFRAFMMATEPCAPELLARILPRGRTFHDSNNNIVYMRPSPDRERLLVGGLTGTPEDSLEIMAMRLHRKLTSICADFEPVRLSHSWTGLGAATFDLFPHIGVHDGVHYAMGYCFAGLPMGTYLGHKAALRILGSAEAATVFDGRDFPSRPYYWGKPWFVPLAMAYYDWRDRRGL